MKMMHFIAAGLAALGLATAAYAAGGTAKKPEHQHWHHAGPFGTFDRQQLQRGFQVYREVCASCHSMDLIKFRNLAERGGPFESGEYATANDNRVVMAIAASYGERVWNTDEINDEGDPVSRTGILADALPAPFDNEQQARASNGGAYPPDLSLITKARSHGADYIYALLTGYGDAPADVELSPGQYYNEYFEGGAIAMAPPLLDDILEYSDGTPATVEQLAEDVTAFLTWAGDPHMEARKQTGWMVLMYLFIFTILVYLAYRQVWANVKH